LIELFTQETCAEDNLHMCETESTVTTLADYHILASLHLFLFTTNCCLLDTSVDWQSVPCQIEIPNSALGMETPWCYVVITRQLEMR